jgi:radical SAM superfamily enzyme YgiQ (UPF0313 family)
MEPFKKVLLIAPQANRKVYNKGGINVGTPLNPGIALAQIAAILLQQGHIVRILDLDFCVNIKDRLTESILDFSPDIVGITTTTPTYTDVKTIVHHIKSMDAGIIVVLGGPHVSALPEASLTDSHADVVAVGEGDYTIIDLIEKKHKADVPGIVYRDGDGIKSTQARPLLADLDRLPFPAWHLYDLKRYKGTKVIQKKWPAGSIETSRGCPFNCVFCNKLIFKHKFRPKSPVRVVDEIEDMIAAGFREVHIEDDGFSNDLDRSKAICRNILARDFRIPWTLKNGIRVDRVDLELLHLMKTAGCYQVAYGIESGNQSVLDRIGKKIDLDMVRKAVAMAKKVGLETYGFFMLGLPGETKETLNDTIDFALELEMDIVKFSIFMPLPGTPAFEKWANQGLIRTMDWSQYSFHNLIDQVYQHPNLEHSVLKSYYKQAYRRYYLRWRYIWNRIRHDFFNAKLYWDVKYFLQMNW